MRIQILPLPGVTTGDVIEEPFALVVDELPDISPEELKALKAFADKCGARDVMVYPDTAEIVDRYATPDVSEIGRLADYLSKHFAGDIGEGSAVDNAIKLLSQKVYDRRTVENMAALMAARMNQPLGYVVARRLEGEGWTSGSRIEPDYQATKQHMAELVRHEALSARYVLCKVVPVDEQERA